MLLSFLRTEQASTKITIEHEFTGLFLLVCFRSMWKLKTVLFILKQLFRNSFFTLIFQEITLNFFEMKLLLLRFFERVIRLKGIDDGIFFGGFGYWGVWIDLFELLLIF